MCGIVGIINNTSVCLHEQLRLMMNSIQHRGPDSYGEWLRSDGKLLLGHRRLAIQDLSPAGHQPMVSKCGRYVLVFNGELYNFRNIRGELSELGWAFDGHSDTEVLLNACVQWGVKTAVGKFKGMFAFSLFDAQKNELKIVRDRVGEKPLYIYSEQGVFAFSSELKAIKTANFYQFNIDQSILPYYLMNGVTPSNDTLYQSIRKLEPATILTIDINTLGEKIEKYWSINEFIGPDVDIEEPRVGGYVRKLEELLHQTIDKQLIADVPVGCFLSGGIDSSLITAIASRVSKSRVKTFSVGFEDHKYDESHFARNIAKHLGTEHYEIQCSENDCLELAPKILDIYDEPFFDPSAIPTILLSKFASKHVKVSLSGDGGDELFWGYSRYQNIAQLWKKYQKTPLMSYFPSKLTTFCLNNIGHLPFDTTKFNRGIYLAGSAGLSEFYQKSMHTFNLFEVNKILGYDAHHDFFITNKKLDKEFACMPVLDIENYLPNDILVKVDRAAMYSSLETRIPLLDHEIIKFAIELPKEQKYKNGVGKHIMREVLQKYVPSNMFDRPKKGFGIPLGSWLRGNLKDYTYDVVEQARKDDVLGLNFRYVDRLLFEHCSGRSNHATRIWVLLLLFQFVNKNKSAS